MVSTRIRLVQALVVGVCLCGILGFGVERVASSTRLQAAESGQDRPRDLIQSHDNTNFPLVGRHRTVECGECHLNGVIQGTPQTCEECHWVRRQDDRYRLQLGSHCGDCHTPQSWKKLLGGPWDHELMTGFRLEGAHRTAECAQCHGDGRFAGTSRQCAGCHLADYQRAQQPNHVAAGFPTDCEACHTSSVEWRGAVVFEHNFFPLQGQHRTAGCIDCHQNGQFAGLSSDCSTCHMDDYNRTTDPNHRQAGFPTDCQSCHSGGANTWEGATLDHESYFPLRGQHQTADCQACHRGGVYAGTPRNCSACHLDDYNRTTDPNHQQAGFPLDCQSCHGTSATTWSGAGFDHNQFFPLQGAHRSLDCQACHSRGYNLPRDCFGCHAQDYQTTRNPNHAAAGFPTNCELCHYPSHTRWSQAVFNHRFPLNGPHNRDCNECHVSGNFRQFSCTVCHSSNETNREHDDVSGYVYDSAACYSCHPDGRER